MRPIYLVHGAWHGSWCWRRVTPLLKQAGAKVTCITLTGLGERAHERTPAPTPETHIADIRQKLSCCSDENAVLVLHSYAGLPGTAAAARHLEDYPGSISRIIYLDARVPEPGERWCDQHTPAEQNARKAAAQNRSDKSIPPPPPAAFGLSGETAEMAARLMTPQPVSLYDAPFEFDATSLAQTRRSFVHCLSPPQRTAEPLIERVRGNPAFGYIALETGHDAMLTVPNKVAAVILADAIEG